MRPDVGHSGAESLLSDAEMGVGRPRAERSLPPEWVDSADLAQEELDKAKDTLVKLTKAQQKRLLKVINGSEAPDSEVEILSAELSQHVRGCEQAIHKVRTAGGRQKESTLLDQEFRHNVQRSLASQLQSLSKQCREAQREYLAEIQRRKSRSAEDVEAGASSSSMPQRYQVSAQAMVDLEEMETLAAQRSTEIAQIASSVAELHGIFKELASLVIDQGTVLDRIDYNTERIYQKTEDARGQMQKALQRKKSGDDRAIKCLLVWGAADIVLLLVLLVKYHLKYGLVNVLIFVLIIGVIVAAAVFACRQYAPKIMDQAPDLQQVAAEYHPMKLWRKMMPNPVANAKAAGQNAVQALRGSRNADPPQ